MRRIFLSVIALALTLAPVNIIANANTQTDRIVASEVLSLREGPGLSYPIKDSLKKGDQLTQLDHQGDWLQVEVNGQKGWVAAWLTKSTQTKQADTTQVVISQVDQLNLRAEPSLSASVLAQLPAGAEAQFIKQQGEWVQIQYGQKQGWVFANYISVNKPVAASASKVTSQASNQANTFTVTVDAVNVRKAPDLTSKKLGLAMKGSQFKVTDRNDNWVQIDYEGNSAWIYSFYGTLSTQQATSKQPAKKANGQVTIIYNGTNLREQASTNSNTVARAQAGESYAIIEQQGDWYKVAVNNTTAYVASWVVSTDQQKKVAPKSDRKKGTLKGVTIVLDPGHGGNDHGTTGVRGTAEKDITSKTAELLKSKLRSAGATVLLTRESDEYVDLRKRVAVGHQSAADAFISIHYDATGNSSVSGITTYYLNGYQKELANYVHAGLKKNVTLHDRGVQQGNYLVLRENRQPTILLELGYLSNASEERLITKEMYREQATLGIYQGLLKYFDAQLD